MQQWIAIVVSLLSLSVSVLTWYQTRRLQQYDRVDGVLTEILKLYLQYPKFRNADYCAQLVASSDSEDCLQYDAFAALVWNYLELLYHTYGSSLEKSPFYGAMRTLRLRNKKWLFSDEHIHNYDRRLIEFLKVSL
jgi:hypothetical protein